MNKAITDGIQLMPPPFSAGLTVWSRENGTPGSDTYDGAADALLIAADADFSGCLELNKTESTQKLRYKGETPMLPGCYWQIRARVKAISGPLPSVRIAAWAGASGGGHVNGVVETGPSVALANYGEVVEVTAIVGSGGRNGVDMVWGLDAIFGHFGIDLTGPNGGVVRVDDIIIEDVSSIYTRTMIDVINVTDFGAVGDGSTDNVAAFEAADAAANGETVLVPEGVFHLNSTLTMNSRIRFQGTITMPASARLQLVQNFDFPTYFEAFGDEQLAFEKAIQALFNFSDHDSLDLKGRSVELTRPVDVHGAIGNINSFSIRRVIRNGRLAASSSSDWNDDVVSRSANYDAGNAYKLTNISNAGGIKKGSLVTGPAGVGREVYVRSVNASSGEVTLSQPLWGAPSSQTYTFTRFKYLLDFQGFSSLSRFVLESMEFACNGRSSAILLANSGLIFHVKDCFFTTPKDRGLTSAGSGCAGLLLDRNQWLSNEQSLAVSQRKSIGFNVNANDAKVRNNRAIRWLHWGVLGGAGNIITGNHFFQDDPTGGGIRSAGLVIAENSPKTLIVGNYVDQCFIDWTNEYDATPSITSGFSFSAMTITGNHFTSSASVDWFRWISIKPYGTGHFLNGVTISHNVFKAINGPALERAEGVDDSIAPLLPNKFRNVSVVGNTFLNVSNPFINPVSIGVERTTVSNNWRTNIRKYLPFEGDARYVTAVQPEGQITTGSGQAFDGMPYADGASTGDGESFDIRWSQSVKGKVRATVRCDDTI
ncbi:MAG: glycosyl hydrolase family 28-related protein [Pseudomonadota bacterium]